MRRPAHFPVFIRQKEGTTMTAASLKLLLDACFMARRVIETLPELPPGMKPRHIHVLDAVSMLQAQNALCRISDVSARLNVTLPGVTRLVQELEAMELLEKYPDARDGRVILLRLTPEGQACVRRYVRNLHADWSAALQDISDEQALDAVHVLNRLLETRPEQAN